MDSIQWIGKLTLVLSHKGIKLLDVDQVTEVEQILREAMEDAWDSGQDFEDYQKFSNEYMNTERE